MKKKRNILLGLTFVFLTSTVIVWADHYNNENTLQRDSEFIQENTGDGTLVKVLENKTSDNEDIKDYNYKIKASESETVLTATGSNAKTKASDTEVKEADTKAKASGTEVKDSDANAKGVDTEVKDSDSKTKASDDEVKDSEKETSDISNKDFDIEGTVLIKYNGTDEKVIVPDVVEVIGKEAFKGNPYVKELILPNSVKCAESEAFAYMENLEVIEKGLFFYTHYVDIYDGCNKIKEFKVRREYY